VSVVPAGRTDTDRRFSMSDVVDRKASEVARDEARERDLSDREQQVLEDLLLGDEAFQSVVEAIDQSVRVDEDHESVDAEALDAIGEGAERLAEARESIIRERVFDARQIDDLCGEFDLTLADVETAWRVGI
jgi:hypothetical protein